MLEHLNQYENKPTRVVILGGSGFVGGELSKLLRSQKIAVLSLGSKDLDLLEKGSESKLSNILRPDDVLVFVSAIAPCKNLEMLQDNIAIAQSVCSALIKTPVHHVIYISSDAVYKDSTDPISESSPAEPESFHGVMHLTRELALREICGSSLTIVRPTLIYGLNDPHNGYGPNQFRRLAVSGKNIVLYGEGEERRDHVYVQDVASLICKCIYRRSIGIINAVSGQIVTFADLASYIAGQYSTNVSITHQVRTGPIPHGGYRAFDGSSLQIAFPEFRSTPWKIGLDLVASEMSVSTES
jgi:nucleoside-diphosphate-sugar epimerase